MPWALPNACVALRPPALNWTVRTFGWLTSHAGIAASGGRVLAKVCTGTAWLVVRSWTFPPTIAGPSELLRKPMDSTLVSGPMSTVRARWGTESRGGGPQYAVLTNGTGPGVTKNTYP